MTPITQQIPLLPITQDEFIAKSRELAHLVRELGRLDAEHAEARKEMREAKALLMAEVNAAAKIIREQGIQE